MREQKDPRRLFTWKQKVQLYVMSKGACERCRQPLGSDWQAHHFIHHAHGGASSIENGAALCLECHKKEHAKMASHEQRNSFRKDYGWQERAVDELMANIQRFWRKERGVENAFVAEVSPSGGKSQFSMKAARELIEAGLIDKAIWIVPRESIKHGFADDSKSIEIRDDKFKLSRSNHLRIDVNLKSDIFTKLTNYHGAVINYQSLDSMLPLFKMWAEDAGFRLLFVFDEAHHGRAGADGDGDACANVWGRGMETIREIAHTIICMTGTPVRADKQRISLLQYKNVTHFDPAKGARPALQVEPDYKFSYPNAIAAGVARKLILRHQDPSVNFRYDRDGETYEFNGPLGAVDKTLIDAAKKHLFSPRSGHIDDMLRLAMEENNRQKRIGDSDAAILVVVGSTDEASGYNPLLHVAERIKALFGEGAVTVESKDGPDAALAIKKFKNGALRWIVAKDMISEGTSIPRLRTVVILRDIKSQVKFEQTVHRATRNRSDDVSQDAIVIYFNLPEMRMFSASIEEEIRLIVQNDKKYKCQNCSEELEFRPSKNRPCPQCGWFPEGDGPRLPKSALEWLSSDFGQEGVTQGGADVSRYDPISRRVIDKMAGTNRVGGRDGINDVLRILDTDKLIHLEGGQSESPFSPDELMQRHWDNGIQNCKKAGVLISEARGLDRQQCIRDVISQCKRTAGMKHKFEVVVRDYNEPLSTLQRFEEASKLALTRAKERSSHDKRNPDAGRPSSPQQ